MSFMHALNKLVSIDSIETKQTKIVNYQIAINQPMIDLNALLKAEVQGYDQHIFQLFVPELNQYTLFDKICWKPFVLPAKYLQLSVIMIKYSSQTKIQQKHQVDQSEQHDISQSQGKEKDKRKSVNHRKQRSKQRTIGQVISLVKQWRLLQGTLEEGKRKNLKETAVSVGISKKSLDDYYYQLRIGQHYCFDFAANFAAKIGVLRNFIRQHDIGKHHKSTLKLPNKLKVISDYPSNHHAHARQVGLQLSSVLSSVAPLQPSLSAKSVKAQSIGVVQQKQNEPGFFWGDPFDSINVELLNDCEDNFFNEFKYDLPDDDPFIGYSSLLRNNNSDNSHNSNQYM